MVDRTATLCLRLRVTKLTAEVLLRALLTPQPPLAQNRTCLAAAAPLVLTRVTTLTPWMLRRLETLLVTPPSSPRLG